jgi:hypothetical protein
VAQPNNLLVKSKLILVIALLTFVCGCGGMPSDSNLRGKFAHERSGLVELVRMSNQDEHVVVIKPNFTYLDTDTSWPRGNIGFSEERWNEYRRMFRKLGLDGGLVRRQDYPSTVFFGVYGSGGPLASSGKGFVYSERPLSPLVGSLDVFPQGLYDGKGHAIAFTKLEEAWYMYREEY